MRGGIRQYGFSTMSFKAALKRGVGELSRPTTMRHWNSGRPFSRIRSS